MVVPLVPILAVAVALAPVSPGLLAVLGTAGVVLGTAGVVLSRRSVDRWSTRDRRG
jgi:hypothetical protein